jgi:hypothetical protein
MANDAERVAANSNKASGKRKPNGRPHVSVPKEAFRALYEKLRPGEIAMVLGISPQAVSMRALRDGLR